MTYKQLSDDALNDARPSHLSERGQLDALFHAGYYALLSQLPKQRIASVEHPSVELVREWPVAVRYIEGKYSAAVDELPSRQELGDWANVRRAEAGFALKMPAARPAP